MMTKVLPLHNRRNSEHGPIRPHVSADKVLMIAGETFEPNGALKVPGLHHRGAGQHPEQECCQHQGEKISRPRYA